MRIFISHANANANIARALAEALEATKTVQTFVSSRAGDLRADEDWLRGIERALGEADAYVILLTPESVLRPWVNFESGADWFSRRKLIFVRIGALPAKDIPLPVASRHVYAVDDEGELKAIFSALGLPLTDPAKWVSRFRQEAAENVQAGVAEAAWEGFDFQGTFYAWAGPLLQLTDRDAVPPPGGLLQEIERRGLRARWAAVDRVPRHLERGLAQVFATDQKSWRRPVIDRKMVLMVANPHANEGAA
jgi:hypothetical protein